MNITQKAEPPEHLTRAQILDLLQIAPLSTEFFTLIEKANRYSRKTFANKGTIFAQIGLNAEPCTVNCTFCNLAAQNFGSLTPYQMSLQNTIDTVKSMLNAGANEIFLMTTADFCQTTYLEIASAVRKILPTDIRLVANTSDFDATYAAKLEKAGFTGVYHICRLDESISTQAKIQTRLQTLEAIKNSALELYYCVEPIGPEHTNEQIADEIARALEFNVSVMAVMRRVNFAGSPMETLGEISAARLAQICAVTTLATQPKRAMGVHEPEIISLISGANQIYAEHGSNPRDTAVHTEQSRGFTVERAKKLLFDANWQH